MIHINITHANSGSPSSAPPTRRRRSRSPRPTSPPPEPNSDDLHRACYGSLGFCGVIAKGHGSSYSRRQRDAAYDYAHYAACLGSLEYAMHSKRFVSSCIRTRLSLSLSFFFLSLFHSNIHSSPCSLPISPLSLSHRTPTTNKHSPQQRHFLSLTYISHAAASYSYKNIISVPRHPVSTSPPFSSLSLFLFIYPLLLLPPIYYY